MFIKSAEFLTSSTNYKNCPDPILPEYAFFGRSNVGKSSLINAISGKKKLAKISGTPGKTITINHFIINSSWYLVDLPGYGYARLSKVYRKKMESFIHSYIVNRKNLIKVFLLVDCRIEPQDADLQWINNIGKRKIPLGIVFTKIDKISSQKLKQIVVKYKTTLLEYWNELPTIFMTSSKTKDGLKCILNDIHENNKLLKN